MVKSKSRVGVVIRESLGGNKSSSKSADLQKLYQAYTVWCKQIATLLQALKAHQQAFLHIEATRTGVSQDMDWSWCRANVLPLQNVPIGRKRSVGVGIRRSVVTPSAQCTLLSLTHTPSCSIPSRSFKTWPP
jgi:hypothetical protein